MLSTEKKRDIIELRAKGYSFAKISETTGAAKQTVVDVCKEMAERVSSLRAIELEALYEEKRVSVEGRIKALSEVRDKIWTELEGRTLLDVPTEKLIDLFLKLNSTIKEEIVEPKFLSSKDIETERKDRIALDNLSL